MRVVDDHDAGEYFPIPRLIFRAGPRPPVWLYDRHCYVTEILRKSYRALRSMLLSMSAYNEGLRVTPSDALGTITVRPQRVVKVRSTLACNGLMYRTLRHGSIES